MKETLNYIEVLLWGYSGFAPMSLNVDYNKSIEQLEERLQALEILNYGKMFDEATSALDNDTQSKIQKAIDNLKGKYTIIIIAHRLSTIVNCDKIFILEKGRISSSGTHKALIKNNKYYRKLCETELVENNSKR